MDVNKVLNLINTLEESIAELKREVAVNPTVNVRVNGPAKVRVGGQEVHYAPPTPELPPRDVKRIIDSTEWPEAVEAELLCGVESDAEKQARAESLLDMTIETNLRDMRFLDYGCGEGHMAVYALERGVALSVGYDPMSSTFPASTYSDRLKLVTESSTLELHGYDVILLYDVLDHCEYPTEVLHHVGKLLAPGGTVYVVCHPWTSRHGGHLYRQFNKAFAHVWLDDADLIERGIKPQFTQRIVNPWKTYRQWFVTTGFTIRSETPITSELPLERFFHQPEIWSRMTRLFDEERLRRGLADEDIAKVFDLDWITYVLQMESIF